MILEKINEKCLEKNYAFIEFNNNENVYKNNKTYLTLKCNKCGNIWSTTSYEKFIYGNRGCPNCVPNKKLMENELVEKIEKLCKEKDFTFLGFNGVFCGVRTKLLLKCNKCGEEWFTTTYNNLRKKTRNTHTCGRKNPSFVRDNNVYVCIPCSYAITDRNAKASCGRHIIYGYAGKNASKKGITRHGRELYSPMRSLGNLPD